MAKATTTDLKSKTDKPARSKTRAAATKPRAVRKAVKSAAPKPVSKEIEKVQPADIERVELTKKELVERLVRDTDMKKGDARRALEAVLGVFREALAEGPISLPLRSGKSKLREPKRPRLGNLWYVG
jgi:hypothetical protein